MRKESTERIPLIVICGPTASGKTSLAVELSKVFDMEVISADSRQVYRGMDIGTAKATPEERFAVPHHLVDVVDPDEDFTVSDFLRLGRCAVDDIRARGKSPVIVGGTGLYIKVLTEGLADVPPGNEEVRRDLKRYEEREGEGSLYRRLMNIDPELACRLNPNDRLRIIRGLEVHILTGSTLSEIQKAHGFPDEPYRLLKIGMSPPREDLYEVIERRVDKMIEGGLEEEVRRLLGSGFDKDLKAFRTIGYREMILFLNGGISREDMKCQIVRETRRYAKRQMTWFKKDKSINWLETFAESGRIIKLIGNFLVTT